MTVCRQPEVPSWPAARRRGGARAAGPAERTGTGRAVRPVTVTGGRVVPSAGEVQSAWFDPAHAAAHYVVLFPGIPGYPGFTRRAAVLATFGPPARVYRAGRYTIWYWPANLLGRLRATGRNGPARG
jgi:hypothetical protein